MKELSRRDFLRAGVIASGALALGKLGAKAGETSKDATFHIEFDDKKGLSFDEAADLALYLDSLADKLPPPNLDVSKQGMFNLMVEIVPTFQKEGATDQAVFPANFGVFMAQDGMEHDHILGRSNCVDTAIINYRFFNPVSALYKDVKLVSTNIHELEHVNQGPEVCATKPTALVENTAQIVTWEIEAAQVTKGNVQFIYPLLDELRDVSANAAYAIALREGKPEKFNQLNEKLYKNPLEKARLEKSQRTWKTNPEKLKYILEEYSENPLNLVVNAIRSNHNMINGLALPEAQVKFGVFVYPPQERTFVVDDLAAFLKDSEKIVDYVARKN